MREVGRASSGHSKRGSFILRVLGSCGRPQAEQGDAVCVFKELAVHSVCKVGCRRPEGDQRGSGEHSCGLRRRGWPHHLEVWGWGWGGEGRAPV